MKKPVVLMILDGWGLSAPDTGNAIAKAQTPEMDALLTQYPHTTLTASGEAVGLPQGQQGNSEVGHLNLGAGRIVYQELTRINKAIAEHTFEKNTVLLNVLENCRQKGSSLHLMGLVSPGGVHSHSSHLLALVQMAHDLQLEKVYIHCFLDGRDVPPSSAAGYIAELEQALEMIGTGQIASVCGRYYAMDRDNRWERVEKAYRALIGEAGEKALSAEEAIKRSYAQGVTDEFILPTILTNTAGQPLGPISQNDGVIFFNFRADRAREISKCFVLPQFEAFDRQDLAVEFVGMTQYEEGLSMAVAFPPEDMINTLGEVLAKAGKKQFRTAETEKYAHVTFFFNGGIEEPNRNEERLLVPSPKIATYDLQPEMSAAQVTEGLLEAVSSGKYDFILVNYANTDMVGHTGNLPAAIRAAETVDHCVGQAARAVLAQGGALLVTADHGNAECMLQAENGQPFTAHTANPVPFVLVSEQPYVLREGILADVAPTVLTLLEIEQPEQMTGRSLIQQ